MGYPSNEPDDTGELPVAPRGACYIERYEYLDQRKARPERRPEGSHGRCEGSRL